MTINNIVWVKINDNNYYRIFTKLNEIGISVYDSKVFANYIIVKISFEDYGRLKKYLITYDISLYSNTGINIIKEYFKKYFCFITACIVSIIFVTLLNNVVIKIDINNPNKRTKDLIKEELKNNKLNVVSFKKSHKEVERIVEKILDDRKNEIEWLEIKYDGLVMIVNVTEKTKSKEQKKYKNCNVIAKTDAKIVGMNIDLGVAEKELNDYVKKGEVILNGSIIHNEEVKNTVCANGIIYGEVWYTVKVELPYYETVASYTGKKRYNIDIETFSKKYKIFKSRIKNKEEELIELYRLNNFSINLIREKEVKYETKKLSKKETYNKALSLAIKKVKSKLKNDEEITYQKVLKKDEFDSKIYLEVFVVTKEVIGERVIIEEG